MQWNTLIARSPGPFLSSGDIDRDESERRCSLGGNTPKGRAAKARPLIGTMRLEVPLRWSGPRAASVSGRPLLATL